MSNLKYVSGDLITFIRNELLIGEGMHYFAHGANCRGQMGGGVAAALARTFPEVLRADKTFWVPFGEARLGKASMADLSSGVKVFNLYSQLDGGPCFSGEALASALADVRARGVCRLTIPKIGAGIGGGNWEDIAEILQASGLKFKVVCFPGDKA